MISGITPVFFAATCCGWFPDDTEQAYTHAAFSFAPRPLNTDASRVAAARFSRNLSVTESMAYVLRVPGESKHCCHRPHCRLLASRKRGRRAVEARYANYRDATCGRSKMLYCSSAATIHTLLFAKFQQTGHDKKLAIAIRAQMLAA